MRTVSKKLNSLSNLYLLRDLKARFQSIFLSRNTRNLILEEKSAKARALSWDLLFYCLPHSFLLNRVPGFSPL